jgi:hypothetical protein
MDRPRDPGPVPVYRAPMRARDRDLSPFEGARCGVEEGTVGIGDALERAPRDLDEAVIAAGSTHGDKARRMLLRFAELPEGVFVWTRTGEDEYRLGRITGPWRYETSESARRTGIHHVRPAEWLPDSRPAAATPAGVVFTYGRGGRNFQRINDEEAQAATARIWEEESPDA